MLYSQLILWVKTALHWPVVWAEKDDNGRPAEPGEEQKILADDLSEPSPSEEQNNHLKGPPRGHPGTGSDRDGSSLIRAVYGRQKHIENSTTKH